MTEEQMAYVERFFKEHFWELQVHAYRFLGEWKGTEDMVMDAFSIACEKIDVFVRSENQIGWMKIAVQNVCWNFLRRQNRENRLVTDWEDLTEDQIPATEDPLPSELIERCKTLLRKKDFRLLYEAVILEIPMDKLAEAHGMSEGACRKQVERIRKKLKKFFEENKNDW